MRKNLLNKQILILISVVVIGVFLRFFNLNEVPMGFSEDEASIGYNAYSILKTGRDETGSLWPLEFEAFGDYKSPLPIYLTVPAVAFWGLSEDAVRGVAAFFGVLTIVLFYLLCQKLFKNYFISITGCLFLAISPWHVQISRTDTEVSLVIFLLLLEMVILLSKYKNRFYLSLLPLVLSLFTHPTALLFAPVIYLYFLLNEKPSRKAQLLNPKLVAFILVFIISVLLIRNSISTFYVKNNFFQEIGFINRVNQLKGYEMESGNPILAKLLQNKYLVGLDQISQNYASSFNWYYLFLGGDYKDLHLATHFGLLYSFEFILFLAGVYFAIRKKYPFAGLFFLLLFLSPLPGILRLVPDYSQTLFMFMIPFYVFVSIGFLELAKSLKQALLQKAFVLLIFLIGVLYSFTFFHYYFVHYSIESAVNWNYGYLPIASKLDEIGSNYQKIVISDRLAQKPYIFTLFYNKIDPNFYQSSLKDRGGSKFVSTSHFDKYHFRSINWEKEEKAKGTLFIGFNDELPDNVESCLNDSCREYMDVLSFPIIEDPMTAKEPGSFQEGYIKFIGIIK